MKREEVKELVERGVRELHEALAAGKPADAVCYLAEIVSQSPADRHSRLALAIALGDGGGANDYIDGGSGEEISMARNLADLAAADSG